MGTLSWNSLYPCAVLPQGWGWRGDSWWSKELGWSPSEQARLLSKDTGLSGYLRCSAWPGQVQMHLWPKPFAGRGDTKPTHGGTEQALDHARQEEWGYLRRGQTLECRNST